MQDEITRRLVSAQSTAELIDALNSMNENYMASKEVAENDVQVMETHFKCHPELWNDEAFALQRAIGAKVLALDSADYPVPILARISSNGESRGTQFLQRMSSLGRGHSTSSNLTTVTKGNRISHTSMSDEMSTSADNIISYLGSFMGLTMVETNYCQICLEFVDVATMYALDSCGHRFCKLCLEDYIASKIIDGLVYPKCFFIEDLHATESDGCNKPCNITITEDDIRKLTSPMLWSKYEKFKFNKENADARECPYCQHVQIGRVDDPIMTCTSCKEIFCYSHSNAHPGATCAEYERARREEEKLNQAKISQIAKLCPGCKTPVEKSGGCNQMKCVTCGINFCWLCGQEVDGGVFPEHFQWWNIAGCAGSQMSESTTEKPSLLYKIVWLVFRLFLCIIFAPPAFVLTLAFSSIACCCIPCYFGGGRDTARSAFLGCFCVSGWVFMAPIVLVLCLPFLPIYLAACICCPSYVPSFYGSDDEQEAATEETGPYQSV